MTDERQRILHELLILRWKRGDRSAVDELFSIWNPRLLYYVRRLVTDEHAAWDIMQQTWLQVVRKLHTLHDPARLPAWLYSVARNMAMAHRRSGRGDAEWITADAELEAIEQDEPEFSWCDVEMIHQALLELSGPHREVMTLFFLHDLSLAEIGEVLDIPIGTVKSRLFHARQKLRAILDRQGVQP